MPPRATGIQVAILVFAIVFLAYPTQKYFGPWIGLDTPDSRVAARLFIFVPAILLLIGIPVLRRACAVELRTPVRPERRIELTLASAAGVMLPFAFFGAAVLWYWGLGGEMALARRLGEQASMHAQDREALTVEGVLFGLVLAGLVAPVVEELVFRGFLYRAWEAQWGWFPSMLASSAVFAAYHPVPLDAFATSLVFVAVLRRAGSIRAPIVLHAVTNIALWPPFLGQFYFRTAGKETGEIALWTFHLVVLAAAVIVVPLYIWMARGPKEDCEGAPPDTLMMRG